MWVQPRDDMLTYTPIGHSRRPGNVQAVADDWETRVKAYENSAHHNQRLHAEFTDLVSTVPWLLEHRLYIESEKLGFGDRAFHYLWYLLIQEISRSSRPVRCLEIGVFKGQVVSLWALIAKSGGFPLEVTGISLLEGNAPASPLGRAMNWLRRRFDPAYDGKWRSLAAEGNIFPHGDLQPFVESLWRRYQLPREGLRLVRGNSHDAKVRLGVQGEYDLVYVDGDHSYEGALQDIREYGALVRTGGYLVIDDAGSFLPGEGYFKGIESVSRACEAVGPMGYENVLNVGHNRVFRRVAQARAT